MTRLERRYADFDGLGIKVTAYIRFEFGMTTAIKAARPQQVAIPIANTLPLGDNELGCEIPAQEGNRARERFAHAALRARLPTLRSQMEKLVPQPHEAVATGLFTLNEAPIRSST